MPYNVPMQRSEALALLCADPPRTGVLTDFDGSLAPIVVRPDMARAVDGGAESLSVLARAFGLVAVVSARSLEDLRSRFSPDGVVLCGSYGRERSDRPRPRTPPQGWETIVVAASARTRDLLGVVVEPKGQGVSIHYRLAPDMRADVERAASELAGEFGLVVRPGRLVAELTVPGPGKAEAVEELVGDYALRAVLFAGDDVADVEAFERLRRLDVASVLVAVASDESPPALAELADVVLAAPSELRDLLHGLAVAACLRDA